MSLRMGLKRWICLKKRLPWRLILRFLCFVLAYCCFVGFVVSRCKIIGLIYSSWIVIFNALSCCKTFCKRFQRNRFLFNQKTSIVVNYKPKERSEARQLFLHLEITFLTSYKTPQDCNYSQLIKCAKYLKLKNMSSNISSVNLRSSPTPIFSVLALTKL